MVLARYDRERHSCRHCSQDQVEKSKTLVCLIISARHSINTLWIDGRQILILILMYNVALAQHTLASPLAGLLTRPKRWEGNHTGKRRELILGHARAVPRGLTLDSGF